MAARRAALALVVGLAVLAPVAGAERKSTPLNTSH
ncbi:MAG: hypothetical protein JWP97_3886 [Labilithrix sp.]|nr:hypothetical protein [Labilithrix sp.]